ncbi:MAG: alcohol dehydrogenase catalytic domain-containing protein [Phycisphaerae bacterium]|jgi:L-iditol 2-dehydrogenase
MKAALLTGLQQVRIDQVPEPKIQRDQDVLLRVDVVGVCGSDVHIYKEGRIGTSIAELPWIVGHESACTVAAVGKGVRALKVGQRVAVDPLIPCNKCDQCLSDFKYTCRDQGFLGSPGLSQGCLTEYIVMPEECCLPVPDNMTQEQIALTEPLSIGLHTRNLGKLGKTGNVVIQGCGPIGLCVLLGLRAKGDYKVYMTDVLDYRLEAGRKFGADWVGSARDAGSVPAAIRKMEPVGVDAVFECAGQEETVDQGLAMLRPRGRLVMAGIPAESRISFDVHLARRQELVIQSVRRQDRCVEEAVELVGSGRIDMNAMVTHHFSLDQTGEAMDLVSNYRDGVLKAMIHVSGR